MLALGAVLLTSCTAQVQISDNGEGEPAFQTADDENSLKTAKSYLDNMTTEEKIGQMFIVRPEALNVSGNAETAQAVDTVTEVMRENLGKFPVGGIAVFGKNITGAEQQQISAFYRCRRRRRRCRPCCKFRIFRCSKL